MKDEEFLNVIKESFDKYLETGSRSNKKLKILHGWIATDLKERLEEDYEVHSLGFGDDKEISMTGRYMNKKVDIAVYKNDDVIAAIALKFIMRNYSQNSNNYFENMLGETANIRAEGKPYFQIVIIPSKVPYFKKGGELDHIEIITENNLSKYIKLSNDNTNDFIHTPIKTLIYIIDIPDFSTLTVKNNDDYILFYQTNNDFAITKNSNSYDFGSNIIYNNYDLFIEKIVHYIKSI